MTRGFLTFALVCVMARLQVVTPLHLEISPSTYTEASSGVVTVSCTLNASDAVNNTVLQLAIMGPGDSTLATVRKGMDKIVYGIEPSDESKFQAKGGIYNDVATSFLKVVISNPTEDDNGIYSCQLDYADQKGLLQHSTASESFGVEIFDIHEVVKQLQTKLKEREAKETQLMKKIEDLTTQCCSKPPSQPDNHNESDLLVRMGLLENNNINLLTTTTLLTDKASNLDHRVTILEKTTKQIDQLASKGIDITSDFLNMTGRLDRMNKAVGVLTSKDSLKSAFSAALDTAADLPGDFVGDIVFNSVIMNEGQGYNATTGKFTAPFHGLYAFHAVAGAYCKDTCYARISLKVNGNLVARLWLGTDDNEDDQSSVTTVAVLKKGDVVNVEKHSGEAPIDNNYYSVFSGYCIKAY